MQGSKPYVQLVGEDGNIFAIVARCRTALKRAGMQDAADALSEEVMASGSYDEALQIVMRYVEVG